MNKGKKTRYHCIWCEKQVEGFLILETKDYIKQITTKQYVHDECPHRVVTIETKGCK